jgi:mRNA interferase YafQ
MRCVPYSMRTIKQTAQFKRDLKREAKGAYRQVLKEEFLSVVAALADDKPLAAKHRDHPLSGELKSFRDCHVRPDLVLIYRLIANDVLELVRLGSHSELSL